MASFPDTRPVGTRVRGIGRGLLAATAGLCALNALRAVGGWQGGSLATGLFLSCYVLAIAALAYRSATAETQRLAWRSLTAGLTCWTLATAVEHGVLTVAQGRMTGGAVDVLWLGFYPLVFAGLGLLMGERRSRAGAGMTLDGLSVGLAAAAVATTLVFGPVLTDHSGATSAVATRLAYASGDLLLLMMAVSLIALHGWRAGPLRLTIAAAFIVWSVADGLRLHAEVTGSFHAGDPLEALLPLGALGLAFAAYAPRRRAATGSGATWLTLLVPGMGATAATIVLLASALGRQRDVAAVLASAALACAIVRTLLALREVLRLLEARRRASVDPLTGLLSERSFSERAAELLDGDGRPHAVMHIGLEHLRDLREALGADLGDALIIETARRLRSAAPDALIARSADNEFLMAIRLSEHTVGMVARELCAALESPLRLHGMVVAVSVRVGAALYPRHATTGGELQHYATLALARASREQRALVLHDPSREDEDRARLELLSDLRAALENGEQIVTHFQPKADLSDGRIVGVEALVRWQHPELGLLAPLAFLPLAEEHGLVHELTLIVLDQSLAQHVRWSRAGMTLPVAVNVAAADLLDTRFPDEVEEILRAQEAEASGLQLEVTENAVTGDPDRVAEVLQRLHDIGVSISLDDFGTGHSSLTRLKRLPVQEVKIDRSFVSGMLDGRDDATIVRSTITLGRNLGLRVVAEGVESDEAWMVLARFGCHQAQGFLLTVPLPADELDVWLSDRAALSLDLPGTLSRPTNFATDHEVLDAVMDAATAVLGADSRAETLQRIARHLRMLAPYDDLAVYEVYEVAEGDRWLRAVHAEGTHVEEVLADQFSVDIGVTGCAVREGRSFNLPRSDLHPQVAAVDGTEIEPEALVCVPLIVENLVVGTLNLYRNGEHWPFSDSEAATVERFATIAALAFHSARQRDELRREAQTDALTGLANLRAFRERLDAMVEAGEPFTLAIVDLDHFKQINDTFGHDEGDKALREAADALRRTVRATDMVARLGGEEFGLLLAETDGPHPRQAPDALSERARAQIGHIRICGRPITASAGTASFPRDGRDPRDLLRLADAALYRSKERGRDRTTAHAS